MARKYAAQLRKIEELHHMSFVEPHLATEEAADAEARLDAEIAWYAHGAARCVALMNAGESFTWDPGEEVIRLRDGRIEKLPPRPPTFERPGY